MPENGGPTGEVQELVTLAEIARRVVDLGYAQTMTRERVSQLSKTDPNWPVPRESWKKLGPYFQIPWPPIEEYFRNRKPVHGVHRSKRETGANDAALNQRRDDQPNE
ncbi:hypothetical protein [Streptacidiphilus carbonis]|uniref:hypothetical protein n=1 Tax=Streptacidiphilus carbonis TaxID=105422 RepID=UPI0012699195|nr:hypothetical protein [Streptacidiphilus carbonis]